MLVVVAAVLLAYNANQGLPFVPTFELKVDTPNAARLVVGNEVREGGFRVGQVTKIEPVRATAGDAAPQLTLQARQVRRRRCPSDTTVAHPPALGARPEVRRARARQVARRRCRRARRSRTRADAVGARARRLLLDLRRAARARTSTATSTTSAPRSPAAARRSTARSAPLPELLGDLAAGHAHARRTPTTRLVRLLRRDRRRRAGPRAGRRRRSRAASPRMADTFEALSRDPAGAAARRSRASPGDAAGRHRRRCRDTRPFLRRLAAISDEIQGTARELRASAAGRQPRAAPPARRCCRRLPAFTERPRGHAARAARRSPSRRRPTSRSRGLTDTMQTLNPTLRWVGPHVTVCNYFNYCWTYLADHISDEDATGTVQRVQVKLAPLEQEQLAGVVRRAGARQRRRRRSRPATRCSATPRHFHAQPYGARGRRAAATPTASPASAATPSAWRPASPANAQHRPRRAHARQPGPDVQGPRRGCPRARPSPPSRRHRAAGGPVKRSREAAASASPSALAVIVVAIVVTYLGFTKDVPFVNEPYEIKAAFRDTSGINAGSPVRIAGVEVGKVTERRARRARARSSATRDDRDQRQRPADPRRRDGEDPPADLPRGQLLRRPRSPARRARGEMDDGDDDPRRPDRQPGPVRPGPRGAEERRARRPAPGRSPSSARRRTRAARRRSTSRCRDQPAAYSFTAIVAEALLGKRPATSATSSATAAHVAGALDEPRARCATLITDFNTTAARARRPRGRRCAPPSASCRARCAPRTPALDALNDAFPDVRRFARDARPGRALARARRSTRRCRSSAAARPRRRARAAAALAARPAQPRRRRWRSVAEAARRRCSSELRALSSCTTNVLVPFGDDKIARQGVPDARARSTRTSPSSCPASPARAARSTPTASGSRSSGTGGAETLNLGNGLFGTVAEPIVGVNPPPIRNAPAAAARRARARRRSRRTCARSRRARRRSSTRTAPASRTRESQGAGAPRSRSLRARAEAQGLGHQGARPRDHARRDPQDRLQERARPRSSRAR